MSVGRLVLPFLMSARDKATARGDTALSTQCIRESQRTLDNQIRTEDTHGGDTDTCLGGSVGGTETCKDDGRCAAHRTEEGLSH